MLPDHTLEMKTQLLAAFNDNGILEFEAGKIYRTTEIRVWKNGSGLSGTPSTPRKMPAAIEGNGATLKWVQGDSPPAGASLLYLWDPQEYGNDGFYVRNLTLDCGNNENGKLKNQGINGELPDGAEACTYGLRIWGGKNFLVENVTVMRGEQAGVLVQTSTGYEVRNVMFRNVMSRFGDKRGWWFSDNQNGTNRSQVVLENCYASLNTEEGFYVDDTEDILMVGCGSEKNQQENVEVTYNNQEFTWLGGYTEKGGYNFIDEEFVDDPDNAMNLLLNQNAGSSPKVTVLGGRMIGRFVYPSGTHSSDWLIHSYGHTRHGFDTSGVNINLPKSVTVVSPIADNYKQSTTQNMSRDNVVDDDGDPVTPNPFAINDDYSLMSPYYTYVSGMTVGSVTNITDPADWIDELENELNIFMVKHIPGMPAAQGDEFDQQRDAARDARGILAFEPDKIYVADETYVFDGTSEGIEPDVTSGECIGVDGNGATLKLNSSKPNVVSVKNPHKNVPDDDENAQYGFWLRDLTIDGTDLADKGLYITSTFHFHFRNLTVTNAKVDAIHMDGFDGSGVYYGVLENVNAIDTNDSANTVDGFELFGDQPNGVRLANVGFYNCESSGNTGRGMNVEGPSITNCDLCGGRDADV